MTDHLLPDDLAAAHALILSLMDRVAAAEARTPVVGDEIEDARRAVRVEQAASEAAKLDQLALEDPQESEAELDDDDDFVPDDGLPDGRDPWTRYSGLFPDREFTPANETFRYRRYTVTVFKLLGRQRKSVSLSELEWCCLSLQEIHQVYYREKKYYEGLPAKYYRDLIKNLTKKVTAVGSALACPDVNRLLRRPASKNRLELTEISTGKKYSGLVLYSTLIDDLIWNCQNIKVESPPGKRTMTHLYRTIPLILQLWSDLTGEKVGKNRENDNLEFKSPSMSFMYGLLVYIDAGLSKQFGAVVNAISKTPVTTFERIAPRTISARPIIAPAP